MTPDSPYPLKVPEGKGQILLAKVNEIPAYCPPAGVASSSGYIVHKVRKGETIAASAGNIAPHRKRLWTPMTSRRTRSCRRLEDQGAGQNPHRPGQGTKAPAPVAAKETTGEVRVKKGIPSIRSPAGTTPRPRDSESQPAQEHELHNRQVLSFLPARWRLALSAHKKLHGEGWRDPFMIAKKHEMELGDFLKINNFTPHTTSSPARPFS